MSQSDTVAAVGYRLNLPATDPNSLIDVQIPRPVPGSHDLLVEVRAVSVNPVDVKQRAGSDPLGQLRILGYDAAGVVREVGGAVTLFQPGDEVYYAGAIDRPGSNSSLQAVDERIVGHKPASLSFTEAAALPLTTITAWEALVDKLRIGADTAGTLLVMGAGGGVGSMVVQLARALAPKLRVVGSTSSADADSWVRELGAHETIDHRADVRAQVERLCPGGVDYLFTVSSKDELALYADLLRPFGEIVGIGDPEVLNVAILKSKSLSWHWELMFARSLHPNEDLVRQHELLERVAALVDAGVVRTTLSETFSPIDAEQLRRAHQRVEAGRARGKVVVTNEV